MLEKPNIPDERIILQLQDNYDLRAAELTFLPLGADVGTAVYRVTATDGTVYFLKLRKNFNEVIVRVPMFLKEHGVDEIIVPFETRSKQRWADFGEYKMILYPFIQGKNGFGGELTSEQKQTLGRALKKIHALQIPPELKKLIRTELYSSKFRDDMRSIQAQVENKSFADLPASKLAEFIKSNQNEITRIIECAENLARKIQAEPPDLVLCHSDIHGGNILISKDGQLAKHPGRVPAPTEKLYIVDWDDPILAPKERDLMFIGGGIDNIWKNTQDESIFYEGYGRTKIDFGVLAYYRYERVIEDLVAYAEQLFLTDEGGADRAPAYRRFTGNFEPGSTIEIADKTIDGNA